MKAIILNSGRGTRLYPMTRYRPKALLNIDSKPLLGYQLEMLIDCGFNSFILTTGPFGNQIKSYVKKQYPDVRITYVKNQKYRTTNYIYSMWLTREFVDDDIILMHGDLFFEKQLLVNLVNSEYPTCVPVKKSVMSPPEKDFKAIIKNGAIIRIGVDCFGENAYFLAPMYKLSKFDYLKWLTAIENAIKQRKTKIYAETVFNTMSDKFLLHPLYFDNEICLEIDTKQDLKQAQKLVRKVA
ncbi:MAG: phosphocholine cytidylyltransferase family protein [Candidatus Bathyarchaeota archaeon]|nr:phosphocholine cytidylyltransferase family protein [Candidatus Bathyarchaeum sp.]